MAELAKLACGFLGYGWLGRRGVQERTASKPVCKGASRAGGGELGGQAAGVLATQRDMAVHNQGRMPYIPEVDKVDEGVAAGDGKGRHPPLTPRAP